MSRVLTAVLVVGLLGSGSVAAEEAQKTEWYGSFVTLGEYRSDTDFSSVGPVYDVDGQSGGFLGARFEPGAIVHASPDVRLSLRGELRLGGGNLPGEHGSQDGVVLFAKDLFAEYGAETGLRGSAGLRERRTASNLVLSQPVLGFGVGWGLPEMELELWAAQAEENSPQGLNFRDDNFSADHWIGGASVALGMGKVAAEISILGSLDRNTSVEERRFGALEVALSRKGATYSTWLSGAVGGGTSEFGTLREQAADLFFWGAEGGLELVFDGLVVGVNSLALSGDDQHDGNGFTGGFQWSGKSRSRTIVLTEDERFMRGNSVAYSMGQTQGAFRELSAGLHVSELNLGYHFENPKMGFTAIAGYGNTLQKAYSGGDDMLGLETGLQMTYAPAEVLEVFVHGAWVTPGAGGAWVQNETDIEEQESVWVIQLGTDLSF